MQTEGIGSLHTGRGEKILYRFEENYQKRPDGLRYSARTFQRYGSVYKVQKRYVFSHRGHMGKRGIMVAAMMLV